MTRVREMTYFMDGPLWVIIEMTFTWLLKFLILVLRSYISFTYNIGCLVSSNNPIPFHVDVIIARAHWSNLGMCGRDSKKESVRCTIWTFAVFIVLEFCFYQNFCQLNLALFSHWMGRGPFWLFFFSNTSTTEVKKNLFVETSIQNSTCHEYIGAKESFTLILLPLPRFDRNT